MPCEVVAFGCVTVGAGKKGGRNVPGRVTIVNYSGEVLYNVAIKHKIKIKDYRTAVTGITPAELAADGVTFKKARMGVASWIRKNILVGHELDKALKMLRLSHPDWNRRDTAEYWRFRPGKKTPFLKDLASQHISVSIQNGPSMAFHSACACLKLYKKYEEEWDDWIYEQTDEEMSDEETEYSSEEEPSDEELSDEETEYSSEEEEPSDEEIYDEETEYTRKKSLKQYYSSSSSD